MSFEAFHGWSLDRFQGVLEALGPFKGAEANRLQQAMTYSLLNGGKRIRPMLVYAAAQACHGKVEHADMAAAAIEMVHCYSLVHDDLPAMDDDDLRRGQPTCHIQYDEATAILAGDALQTEAFNLLSQPMTGLEAHQQLAMVNTLAKASGLHGMAGGQSLDLEAIKRPVDLAYLETMHRHKTGALIAASVQLGAQSSPNVQPEVLEALYTYGLAIGLAFQVQDDILDVVSDTQTLGKTQGADAANNKPTYVSLLGLDGATEKAHQLHKAAIDAITPLGEPAINLAHIADYIIKRVN